MAGFSMKTSYSDLASAHEVYGYGKKSYMERLIKKSSNEDALSIIPLLFGEGLNRWSYVKMITHIGKLHGIYNEVVMDVVGKSKESLIEHLVSESSHKGKGWSLQKAVAMTLAFTSDDEEYGEVTWLDCAKEMNQVEARLFWRNVLGARQKITKITFLRNAVRNGVTEDMIVLTKDSINNINLREAFHTMLHNPKEFVNEEFIIYTPRKMLSWKDGISLSEYNGGFYQVIEGKGNRKVYEDDNCVVEMNTTGTAYDCFFFKQPELNLRDRLQHLGTLMDLPFHDVAYLYPIPSWSKIEGMSHDNTIRFPSMEPYKPNDVGGYLMVLNQHIHPLRLAWYHIKGAEVEIGYEALDGTDFFSVGSATIKEGNKVGMFHTEMKKHKMNMLSLSDMKTQIPDDKCIIVEITSPSFSNMEFQHSKFYGFNNELGITDVMQIADVGVL